MKIVVEAFWDADAKVWVASTPEPIGLATEARSIEELQSKLAILVPDLLSEENPGPFEIELVARSSQLVSAL
jgi:hypothetical protein